MPRVGDVYLDAVVFVYPSADHAARDEGGGTGFMVGMRFEEERGAEHVYVVTAAHLLYRTKTKTGLTPVRHWNWPGRREGSIFPTVASDWVPHRDGDDIAIAPVATHIRGDRSYLIDANFLVTKQWVASYDVGVGHDVFYVGRYKLPESACSVPTVRFGNISHMPMPVWHPGFGREVTSFLVEGRSRGGFSGSPVIVRMRQEDEPYSAPSLAWDDNPVIPGRSPFHGTSGELDRYILGLNWGHATEEQSARGYMGRVRVNPLKIDVNEGIMCVAPAWRILDVLNSDKLREHREREEAGARAARGGSSRRRIALDELPESSDAPTRAQFFADLRKIKKQPGKADGQP